MFPFPQRTDRTSVERLRSGRRAESHRRRFARIGLFDRLESRTLLSATDPGWALRAGGSHDDAGRSVTVDSFGDVYMTGYFSGTADFGGISLTSVGSADGYVAKYAPNGSLLWATRFGGSATVGGYTPNSGTGVTVAPDGSVYLAGFFAGVATFGNSALTLTSSGQQDVVAARLDPTSGQFLWAQRMGGTGGDLSHNIVADSTGIYLTGTFASTASFGPTNLTSAGGSDIFVTHLDTWGNFVWSDRMGGSRPDEGWGLALDGAGSLYVTGDFEGTANFGGLTLSSPSIYHINIYVVQVQAATGAVTWADGWVSSLSNYGESGRGLVTDSAGNIYVTGEFCGTVKFGSTTLSATGSDPRNAFVAELSPGGGVVWARQLGSPTGFGIGSAIALDPSGLLDVTGKIDSANLYRVNTSGTVVSSATLYSMAGASPGMQIVSDAYGILYLTGSFWTQTGFNTGSGTVTLTPAAGSASNNADIFLLKYNPNLSTTAMTTLAIRPGGHPAGVSHPPARAAVTRSQVPQIGPQPSTTGMQGTPVSMSMAPLTDQDLTALAAELIGAGKRRRGRPVS